MKNRLWSAGILALGMAAAASVASASTCTVGENLIGNYAGSPNNFPNTAPSGALTATPSPNLTCSGAGTSLVFSNFSYLLDNGSFATTTPTISVEEASVGAGGTFNLEFDPNLAASSDLLFEFQVTGGVTEVDLTSNATGTGFINEVVCTVFATNGVCPAQDVFGTLNVQTGTPVVTVGGSCAALTGGTCTAGPTSGGTASITFGGSVGSLWVFKDIESGNAPYSEVEQSFGVPEPMTLSLMGAGLLGLGLLRRRIKK